MQCLHDPFQQTDSAYLWSEELSRISESLYDKGCLTVVSRPIEKALSGFITITVFIFIFQVKNSKLNIPML